MSFHWHVKGDLLVTFLFGYVLVLPINNVTISCDNIAHVQKVTMHIHFAQK